MRNELREQITDLLAIHAANRISQPEFMERLSFLVLVDEPPKVQALVGDAAIGNGTSTTSNGTVGPIAHAKRCWCLECQCAGLKRQIAALRSALQRVIYHATMGEGERT